MIVYTDELTSKMNNGVILIASHEKTCMQDAALRDICRSLQSYKLNGLDHSVVDRTVVSNTNLKYILYLDVSDEGTLRKSIQSMVGILGERAMGLNVVFPHKLNTKLSDDLWSNVLIPELVHKYLNSDLNIYIQKRDDSSVIFETMVTYTNSAIERMEESTSLVVGNNLESMTEFNLMYDVRWS